jgi:hypothetical protein
MYIESGGIDCLLAEFGVRVHVRGLQRALVAACLS